MAAGVSIGGMWALKSAVTELTALSMGSLQRVKGYGETKSFTGQRLTPAVVGAEIHHRCQVGELIPLPLGFL